MIQPAILLNISVLLDPLLNKYDSKLILDFPMLHGAVGL